MSRRRIVLLPAIFLLGPLLWGSPVNSAPHSNAAPQGASVALLDEVRRAFTVGGQTIPPEIFRDLGDGNIADSGSIWVTVNVQAAVGSNLYADPIKAEGNWVSQTKLNDATLNGSEQTAYRFIGATRNKLLVAVASYNGGGSGTFFTLHILDATLTRAFDTEGIVVPRVFLTGIRSVVLGDRWAGDVSVSGNLVTITTTRRGATNASGVTTLEAKRP